MKKGQKLVKALAIFTMSAAAVSCAVAVEIGRAHV